MVRRETEALQGLQVDKGSQGGMDLMGPRGPLETPVLRVKVSLDALEIKALQGPWGQKALQGLQVPWDLVWLEYSENVGPPVIQDWMGFLVPPG